MPDQQPTTCLNCDTEFSTKYCPECGQPATTGRLDLRGLVRELAADTFHLDTGFLRTFMALLRNPGAACCDYIDGKRRSFSSPLRYCLTVLAITVLAYKLTGFDPTAELAASNQSDASKETALPMVEFATRYPSVSFFLPLPLVALLHRWMFRKSGRNYLEIVVFNLFVAAQFNLLFLPVQLFAPLPFQVVSVGVFVALLPYFVWAARPFFGDPLWKIMVKTLLMTALLYIVIVAGTVAFMFATDSVPTPAG